MFSSTTLLSETDLFKKSTPLVFTDRIGNKAEFIEVTDIGDGNCGAYALSLVVFDLIKRGKLNLSENRFRYLSHQIKKSLEDRHGDLSKRLLFYFGDKSGNVEGNPYSDLVEPLLSKIKDLTPNHDLSFAEFKNIIAQCNSQHEVAAMIVALGPAIRQICIEASQMKKNGKARKEALEIMSVDAIEMDDEALKEGAQFLGINVNFYQNNGNNSALISIEMGNEDELENAPTGYIVRKPGHFNALIPIYQRDGLGTLPAAPGTAEQITRVREQNYAENKNTLLSAFRANQLIFNRDKFEQLKNRAQTSGCTEAEEQSGAPIQKNSFLFFGGSGEKIAVTKALQEELDKVFATHIQLNDLTSK